MAAAQVEISAAPHGYRQGVYRVDAATVATSRG